MERTLFSYSTIKLLTTYLLYHYSKIEGGLSDNRFFINLLIATIGYHGENKTPVYAV